jgi:hypothetical protein
MPTLPNFGDGEDEGDAQKKRKEAAAKEEKSGLYTSVLRDRGRSSVAETRA